MGTTSHWQQTKGLWLIPHPRNCRSLFHPRKAFRCPKGCSRPTGPLPCSRELWEMLGSCTCCPYAWPTSNCFSNSPLLGALQVQPLLVTTLAWRGASLVLTRPAPLQRGKTTAPSFHTCFLFQAPAQFFFSPVLDPTAQRCPLALAKISAPTGLRQGHGSQGISVSFVFTL